MLNYVCDISKRKSISYVIRGIELFRFSLIDKNTVEILCECGHSFQAKITDKMHLNSCNKCGCLWHLEEDTDKITLIQPRTNFGLTFAKTKEFFEEVDAVTKKADEERRQRILDLNKHDKLGDVLKFIKKSGINQKKLIKALRSNN